MFSLESHLIKPLFAEQEMKENLYAMYSLRVVFRRRPDALSYHIAILQLMKDQSDSAARLLYQEVTRRRLCPEWITGTAHAKKLHELFRLTLR